MIWILGACSSWTLTSDLDGDGYTVAAGDCDDSNISVAPNKIEVCDGLDNDCNDIIDDATGNNVPIWYEDLDGDGHGVLATARKYCPEYVPDGFVQTYGDDCDDTNANIYPDAVEVCDGLDNDCDLRVDVDAIDALLLFPDLDGDSYGANEAAGTLSCSEISGYSDNNLDCDDGNASINPVENDICDGLDNDCNGNIDDGALSEMYFLDNDGDGYGDDVVEINNCSELTESMVSDGGDCDDSDSQIYPGSSELSEQPDSNFGVDYNCDGLVACLDIGCDTQPELWLSPTVGDSYILDDEGGAYTLNGISQVEIAKHIPLQSDYFGRLLVSHGDSCSSDWLGITMTVDTPLIESLGVYSTLPQTVLIHDFNGDDVSDVVVVNGYGTNEVSNCSTTPSIQTFAMQLQPSSSGPSDWRVQQSASYPGFQGVDAQVVDMDNNGDLDILVCSYQDSSAQPIVSNILYDVFSGPSGSVVSLAVERCRAIDTLDWNNDGLLDVVIASDLGQYLLRNDQTFTPLQLHSEPSGVVITQDIDGDALTDIIFASTDPTGVVIQVYLNGSEVPIDIQVEGCTEPQVRKLDKDEYPELICPNPLGDSFTIFWGSDQGWSIQEKHEIQVDGQRFFTTGYWRDPLIPSILLSPSEGLTDSCLIESMAQPEAICSERTALGALTVSPVFFGALIGSFD